MGNEAEQLHAIVRGLVQGVNFRSSTVTQARRLRLSGWVRNLPDGSVEIVAEGPRSALDQFLQYLQRGPTAARVSDVNLDRRPATESFNRFEVRW